MNLKKNQKWLVGVLTLILVLALSACANEDLNDTTQVSPETPVVNENTDDDSESQAQEFTGEELVANLKTSVEATYNEGVLASHFDVTNTSDMSMTVTFPSGQRFDYQIKDEAGTILFTWSYNKSFIEMLSDETLEAGSTWAFDDVTAEPELILDSGEYTLVYMMSFYVGEEMVTIEEATEFSVE